MSRPAFPVALALAAALTAFPLGLALAAQPPTRDASRQVPQPPAAGTARVIGSVTVLGTGQPARNARVTLAGGGSRPRSATTDEQGRFAFSALPAGRYTVAVSKAGHVTASYGQRRPGAGRPGTAIQLADGQEFTLRLALPRGGVLTGTIVDEHGDAATGTQVRVMRYAMQAGGRALVAAGSGSTDDRGIFRVYGLQPGEYVVCATPRNTNTEATQLQRELEVRREMMDRVATSDPVQARQLQETVTSLRAQMAEADDGQTGYAPVCYPGTTDPAAASPLALDVSEERTGVDFQLQLVALGSVSGTVMLPAGTRAQNMRVVLVSAAGARQRSGIAMPALGTLSTNAGGPDGLFRIANVPPGQYTVTVRGMVAAAPPVAVEAGRPGPRPAPVRMWGAANVVVDGRAVDNVAISLQPGMTVSGQISFEGGPAPADLTRVRVTVSPAETGGDRELTSGASATADAAGRFTIRDVMPGHYRLTATAGAGWFTASSIVSGQDSLDFPFEVAASQNVSGAALTLSNQPAELQGTVVDDRGQPATDYTLIVFAADRRYWTPGTRRVYTTRPATDGSYMLRNLPPGEYRIATLIDPEPGAWTDPAYLEQLESSSMRITIAAGEKKVQGVRIADR